MGDQETGIDLELEQLRDENARLKRKIERERDFSTASMGNSKAVVAKYQRERDEAKRSRDELADAYESLRVRFIDLEQEYDNFRIMHEAVVAGMVRRQRALVQNWEPARVLNAYRLGTVTYLQGRIRGELHERQEMISALQNLQFAISDALRFIALEAARERETLFEKAQLLEEVKTKGGLPYIADRWLDLLSYSEGQDSDELLDINSPEANKEFDEDVRELNRVLRKIIFFARATERAHLSTELLDADISHADDIHMVAYDILEGLRSPGGLSIPTLERLPRNWIDQYIKQRVALKTLQKGLTKAHQWNKDGRPTQSAFAELHNFSVRNLNDYIL